MRSSIDILVITFDLGVTSSGIVTDRVCSKLHENGHKVRVLSSRCSNNKRPYSTFTASPEPLKPARAFNALGNIIGRDLNYIFWEHRATRAGMKLISAQKPDVIYARGSPGCSFSVGYKLSRASGVPLVIHFADPIPATPDWEPSTFARRKHIRTILPAQRHAALVTVVNSRMLEYQQETTGDELKPKSLILPNPVPDPMLLAPPPDDRFVFTFLGSFLGSRRPDSLLSAFARLTKRFPAVELHIYGNWPNSLSQRVANDPDLFGRVLLKGWTHDVGFVLSNSSCLVDIDADSVHSVYTSNKLMEYISTDRPVLLISPLGSASRDLVKSLKQTCLVVDHNIDLIYKTMENLIVHKIQKYKFTERKKLAGNLSTSKISYILENRLEKLLNNSELSKSVLNL